MELDPRNARILTGAAVTFELLRDYKQLKGVCDRLIAIEPSNVDYRARRAFIDFAERADTRPAHSVVGETDQLLEVVRHNGAGPLSFYERDTVAADRALAELAARARIILMQEV